MKRYWISMCVLGLMVGLIYAEEPKAAEKPAAEKPATEKPAEAASEFKTLKEKVSYGLGLNIAGNLLRQGFDAKELDVDVNVLVEGFRDAISRAKPRMGQEELAAAMEEFQKQMQAKQKDQAAKMKEAGEKSIKEGEAFLAENGKKEGVKTTKSGLQYSVIKEGDGAKPKAADTVKVHYRGTLLSGKEFDSSYKRNEPAVFPLDRVISGWTEGVQLMTVGSKYKLFLPSDLAYGPEGSPPDIGPNSVLVFEIELLGIEKQ